MTCAFDLSKPRRERAASRPIGNENAGRSYHGIDDIAWPQEELLDAPIDAGANVGLVQIHLRFGERRLRACFLRRQQRTHPYHRGLLRSGHGIQSALTARDSHLELFNIALRHNARVALLQLALDVELVRSLLQRAL